MVTRALRAEVALSLKTLILAGALLGSSAQAEIFVNCVQESHLSYYLQTLAEWQTQSSNAGVRQTDMVTARAYAAQVVRRGLGVMLQLGPKDLTAGDAQAIEIVESLEQLRACVIFVGDALAF